MAITKTKFINYIRCPRYVVLDKIKKDDLTSFVSYDEYKKEETNTLIEDLKSSMFDESGNDLVDVVDEQLETMLPYYNKIESLAGQVAQNYFSGKLLYSDSTYNQESFDVKIEGIRYLCYVDILNEVEDYFNIIEVKATTTKKFLSLGVKNKEGNINSIFQKKADGIYYLLEEIGIIDEDYINEKKYKLNKEKLYDKYNDAGRYVYDLAVQRYIIENDLKATNREKTIPNIKYYLAVLNHEYVFSGDYKYGEPNYEKDKYGNDIISYIDLTKITKEMQDIIENDRKRVDNYIKKINPNKYPIGKYCEKKKSTKCKFIPVCWDFIPKENSILNFIDNHHGFKDQANNKYETYDLINDGIISIKDMPNEYLNRPKNIIQKNVVMTNNPYVNYEKIKAGISNIEFPIYHLDFETFPCPLPRFRDEKCYSQSVFQFSIHIEKEPNNCDKDKDHYEFLAKSHNDEREELIKKMCEYIDLSNGGTVLVYNESFEKTRLKELAEVFPEYKEKLLKIRNHMFDLMYIVKTNSSFYKELGFSLEEAKTFNYYHKDMSGSFSIKKILPLFTSLSYNDLIISNGIQALVSYAKYPSLSEMEHKILMENLIAYCKQDTWAMVEILQGLKKLVM